MDGRFGLMETAEQVRSTGEQLASPFNDPVGYWGPTPPTFMDYAEEFGWTFWGVLCQFPQDEYDIFFRRPRDHRHATTSALVLPKEDEREEAAEKDEEEEIMYKVDQKLHEQLMKKHYYPKYSRKSCRSSRKRSSK